MWQADLSGADLSGVRLHGVKGMLQAKGGFKGADLSGLTLTKLDLKGFDLSRTNLCKATLSGADLTDANLTVSPFEPLRLRLRQCFRLICRSASVPLRTAVAPHGRRLTSRKRFRGPC